jgi:hypothetical protein
MWLTDVIKIHWETPNFSLHGFPQQEIGAELQAAESHYHLVFFPTTHSHPAL